MVEVVAWVAPTGRVLATRTVRSQQVPARLGSLPALEEQTAPRPSTVDALAHCPGTRDAWQFLRG